MGNRKPGAGNGNHTGEKERFFALCLGDHITREARFLESLRFKRPYFHLDLNAGPGFNEAVRHEGTPINFMRQAAKYPNLAIEAAFIERNPLFVMRLRDRLGRKFGTEFNGKLFGTDRSFRTIRGDNEEHLIRFVQEVVPRSDRPEYAVGSIICDPNGWSRNGGSVSIEALRAAAGALPRFLLLIFFPYALAKMVRGYAEAGAGRENVTVRRVSDFLSLRPHWLISAQHGGFVYLCGSSRRMREGTLHVPAFHHDSELGRSIIADCDTIRSRARAISRRQALVVA